MYVYLENPSIKSIKMYVLACMYLGTGTHDILIWKRLNVANSSKWSNDIFVSILNNCCTTQMVALIAIQSVIVHEMVG